MEEASTYMVWNFWKARMCAWEEERVERYVGEVMVVERMLSLACMTKIMSATKQKAAVHYQPH